MRSFLLYMCFLVLCAVPAQAAGTAHEIAQVEDYLNNIKTLSAHFVQTDDVSGQARGGIFYLQRPGRLRFAYDAPVRDFIVADGHFVHYYDADLKQDSNAPVGSTLADFLVRDNLRFSGDLSVVGLKREEGLLQMTVTRAAEPESGSLTLFFAENPLILRKWRVVDAAGAVTEVVLSNLETGITLDPDLFYYRDPERAKPHYN